VGIEVVNVDQTLITADCESLTLRSECHLIDREPASVELLAQCLRRIVVDADLALCGTDEEVALAERRQVVDLTVHLRKLKRVGALDQCEVIHIFTNLLVSLLIWMDLLTAHFVVLLLLLDRWRLISHISDSLVSVQLSDGEE